MDTKEQVSMGYRTDNRDESLVFYLCRRRMVGSGDGRVRFDGSDD